MLTPSWRKIILVLALSAAAIILAAWESNLLPATADICEESHDGSEHCDSYNIFFAVAWNMAKAADHWSVSVTALATVLLAYITYRLVRLGRDQAKTSRAQLRAYMGHLGAHFESVAKDGDQAGSVKYFEKNSGSTPALKTVMFRHIEPFPLGILPPSQMMLSAPESLSLRSFTPAKISDRSLALRR